MNYTDYMPKPIDTSRIELSDELLNLIEEMAVNVHEVWAAARMEQGWRYGLHRDDTNKLHPCLQPYDTLPETEKAYDRNTAIETLKFILKQGFNISKKS